MTSKAELNEAAASLRRQESLLEKALATGLRGEQRRLQSVLLRHTKSEVALIERAERAVHGGWEPFEVSKGWPYGYVEDPRFLCGHTRVASALAAAPLAAIAGVLLLTRWDVLPAALMAGVTLLGLQAMLYEVLGRLAERHDRELGEGLRLFNAPMPAQAAVAYRRARESKLFDTFVVHSPRAADFRAVAAAEAPSLGLLDPVLIGRIGPYRFLVAQWDLADDLASL